MNSLSNYLYNKNPGSYGGMQEEYLQSAERAIGEGARRIQSAVDTQKDLTELFFDVMKFFQQERKEIAIRHATFDAFSFGTLRTDRDLGSYFAVTPLDFDYVEYGQLFKKI